MSKTEKKFLKKYLIKTDGTITDIKTGEVIEPKKGKVKLKTPDGKQKFEVEELMTKYFPETIDASEIEVNDPENLSPEDPAQNGAGVKEPYDLPPPQNGLTKEDENKVDEKPKSKPQLVRDYYDQNREAFTPEACSVDLSIPPSYVVRTIDTYKEKLGIETEDQGTDAGKAETAPTPSSSEDVETQPIILEVNGKRFALAVTLLN